MSTRIRRNTCVQGILIAFIGVLGLAPPARAGVSTRTLFIANGEASADDFGDVVAAAGDLNGDGFADVIVGAPLNNAGGVDAGRAYVFFGGPNADAVADLVLTGTTTGDHFGASVARAGDVNRDGYDDVVVGAPFNDAGGISTDNRGRAYVFFGSATPDNVADLTLTGLVAGDQFGASVAGAGDFNRDGAADLVVGAPLNDAGGVSTGQAYVFFGGASLDNTADVTMTGLGAGDQFGTSVSSAGDFDGDGISDVIVGAPFNSLSTGRAYIFLGEPVVGGSTSTSDVVLIGEAAGDEFGHAVAGIGDESGDGFADVIVGAPENDLAAAGAGAAYVYRGGPLLDGTADLSLLGGESSAAFGSSVASAGDVNGDGYADWVVGAPVGDVPGESNVGEAAVYFGGAGGGDALVDLAFYGDDTADRFADGVAGVGDFDGDGHGDLVAGAPDAEVGAFMNGRAYFLLVYPYQVICPNGGETWVAGMPVTVRWRGHNVANLALSLDGGVTYTTVAIGVGGAEENSFTLVAPGTATDFARVRLAFTGATVAHATSDASDRSFRIVLPVTPPAAAARLQLTFTGAAAGDQLGNSVASAGDVNGDGFDDLVVGAKGSDSGGANAGQAYVYFGGAAADAVADLTLTGGMPGDDFGWSVAGAGDVNGDGFDDVIVGAIDVGTTGAAYLYLGGSAPDNTADLTLMGVAGGDEFGHSVASGDVNGDGFADMIVGARLAGAGDVGQAQVYFGGPTPDGTADLTLNGEVANDAFGYAVASAGDFDGDGYDDVIVGAPFNDAVAPGAGRAYLYRGGPIPDGVADLVLGTTADADQFGVFVSSAGDVNGDGAGDVVVGAWQNDAGGATAGRAYVYFGGACADAIPDMILTGAAAGDQLGTTVASPGDVNGDGFDDLIVGARKNDAAGADAGRVYVFYGGPAPDATADVVFTGFTALDNFGDKVSAAGDVNGDGFDDVIVGAMLNDALGDQTGRAYLYDLNRYHLLTPNGGETWNVGGLQTISWLGAEPADVWLSVDAGRSFERLLESRGGLESNVVSLQVPHAPTRFALVKLTPSNTAVRGEDRSAERFTIEASVLLLSFEAAPTEGGVLLRWASDPAIGREGLLGYRLYRLGTGETGTGTQIGPELIVESRYVDRAGTRAHRYRLTAVNGLREERELGRVGLAAAFAGLRAWPTPLAYDGTLHVQLAAPLGSAGLPATDLEVALYDVRGRRVAVLFRGQPSIAAGLVSLEWKAGDRRGMSAGMYFLRAVAPSSGLRLERKLVLMP